MEDEATANDPIGDKANQDDAGEQVLPDAEDATEDDDIEAEWSHVIHSMEELASDLLCPSGLVIIVNLILISEENNSCAVKVSYLFI